MVAAISICVTAVWHMGQTCCIPPGGPPPDTFVPLPLKAASSVPWPGQVYQYSIPLNFQVSPSLDYFSWLWSPLMVAAISICDADLQSQQPGTWARPAAYPLAAHPPTPLFPCLSRLPHQYLGLNRCTKRYHESFCIWYHRSHHYSLSNPPPPPAGDCLTRAGLPEHEHMSGKFSTTLF